MKNLLKKIAIAGLSTIMTVSMAVAVSASGDGTAAAGSGSGSGSGSSSATTVKVDTLTLDVTDLVLYKGGTFELNATVKPKGTDITWTVNEEGKDNVTVVDGVLTGVKVTDPAVEAGDGTEAKDAEVVTVTATAGDKTATCKVTVKEAVIEADDVLFTDSGKTKALDGSPTVYVNGGKVKDVPIAYEMEEVEGEDGKKTTQPKKDENGNLIVKERADVNYKQSVIYSSVVPEAITIKGKAKSGKLITFVTNDQYAVPVIEKGKVVKVNTQDDKGEATTKEVSKDDLKAAKELASASVKAKDGTATITIKSGKKEGTAYVWIIDVRADKNAGQMFKIPVVVNAAPKAVMLLERTETTETETDGWVGIEYNDEDGSVKALDKKANIKKESLAIGESATYLIVSSLNAKAAPFVATAEQNYEVTVDDKGKAFVTAAIDGDTLVVSAVAVDSAKPTKAAKAKVTVVNKFNNKKTALTVTVTNDIVGVNTPVTIQMPDATEEKQTVELAYAETKSEDNKLEWTIKTNATKVAEDAAKAIEDNDKKAAAIAAIKYPYQSTDKIKLYVTSDEKLAETKEDVTTTYGYNVENVKGKDKFTLSAKSKDVSAKLSKEGKITLTVKKGVAEAKGKLLIVCTHVDKTIDVYEVALAPAPSVKVDKASVEVEVGKTDTVTVTVANGAEDATVTVKSADETKATASITDGKVTITGVAAGETTVTVTYGEGDAAVKAEIAVKVTAPAETTTTTAAQS